MDQRFRIGIIGAGAIVEKNHLPIALNTPGVEVVGIVDKDSDRAIKLASQFNIKNVYQDPMALLGKCNAVINALPNDLHVPVSMAYIKNRQAVLVEKPIAVSSAEARDLMRAARDFNTVLAIGHFYRFSSAAEKVKKIFEQKILGKIHSLSMDWGGTMSWPVRSGFLFDKQQAGGGILIDEIHALDLLLWWFGPLHVTKYRDDSCGGVESECEMRFRFNSEDIISVGLLKLSRARALANRLKVEGTKGKLEIELVEGGKGRVVSDEKSDAKAEVFYLPLNNEAALTAQMLNFKNAVMHGESLKITPAEAVESVEIIERCYNIKTSLLFEEE